MARRLDTECVALLADEPPRRGVGDGWDRLLNDENRCRTIQLGPISEEHVGEWANRLGIELSSAQAARLHRHTGGHPLYVKTLLTELTPDQLTSATQELPAPRSLASATIAALAELPEDANSTGRRHWRCWASAPRWRWSAGSPAWRSRPRRWKACSRPASCAGCRGSTNTPIDFVHPLYRLAVYDDLSPTRRQALHRAAAENLGRAAGWPHRVAAADTADDALADELRHAGRRRDSTAAPWVWRRSTCCGRRR